MRPGLKGQSINVGEGEASLLTVVPAAPKALKILKMIKHNENKHNAKGITNALNFTRKQ